MSISEDLRDAARWIDDSCGEQTEIGDGLRAHAETIERIEREMRDHAADWRHEWKQASDWANALKGDKP